MKSALLKVDEINFADKNLLDIELPDDLLQNLGSFLTEGFNSHILSHNAERIHHQISNSNYLGIFDFANKETIYLKTKPKILAKQKVELDMQLIMQTFRRILKANWDLNPLSILVRIQSDEREVISFSISSLTAFLSLTQRAEEPEIIPKVMDLLLQFSPFFTKSEIRDEENVLKFSYDLNTGEFSNIWPDNLGSIQEMAFVSVMEGAKTIMQKLHNRPISNLTITGLDEDEVGFRMKVSFSDGKAEGIGILCNEKGKL